MSLWRQVIRGTRVIVNRAGADDEIRDELQDYLDHATAAHVARGLSPDAARRAARLEVGNMTSTRERVRAYGWENVVSVASADLRYAGRRLRRNPAFTALTVITLALGIGASTSIFSAVNPILFEPLPYPGASRIMMVWYNGADGTRANQSFGNYRELVTRSRDFTAMAAMTSWQPTMTSAQEPERIDGQRVSASYFNVLAVPPALGRSFDPADDRPNGANVAVISNVLWQRRFHGDSAIIGKRVTLNDQPYDVIGVMPPGFENVSAPSAEIWSLLQFDSSLPADGREWGHNLRVIGRVKAGIGAEQAKAELDQIARSPIADFTRRPSSLMSNGMIVNSLQGDVTAGVRPALLAVLGAVLLLLVIACVNVTSLLLARGVQRRGEFAMRAALGAARWRLVRQMLTESLVLAAAGGVAGLVVAEIGVRALVALSPGGLPRLGAIRLNGVVFAFAAGASALTGLVIGLIPAIKASREDLRSGLQHGSRNSAASHRVVRRALVIAEVALALVLLVGSGLLLRSLQQLFAVAPGFDASNVATMQVQVSSAKRFSSDSAILRFYAQALEQVRQVPGVVTAGFTSQLPLTGDADVFGVTADARAGADVERGNAFRYAITPEYFEALRIPLKRGRLFDERDMTGAAVRPVVINESFAKHLFGVADPVGQRIRFGGPPNRHWDVVVGVVGDVKQASLAVNQSDAVYVATSQWLWVDNPMWLVVRARGDAASLAPAIKRAIWSVDKDQPVTRVATMDHLLAASAAERRFVLVILEAFASVALMLAAIGIYGVVSGSVTERQREIGIRSALGASTRDIVGQVVRQGMAMTALGVIIGLTLATIATRAIATLLFGVSRLDSVTYVGVVVLVAGVSVVACLLPASRAAAVDPAIALRAE